MAPRCFDRMMGLDYRPIWLSLTEANYHVKTPAVWLCGSFELYGAVCLSLADLKLYFPENINIYSLWNSPLNLAMYLYTEWKYVFCMLLPTKDVMLQHKMTVTPSQGSNVTQGNQMSGGLLFLEYNSIMFVCCLILYIRLKTWIIRQHTKHSGAGSGCKRPSKPRVILCPLANWSLQK